MVRSLRISSQSGVDKSYKENCCRFGCVSCRVNEGAIRECTAETV